MVFDDDFSKKISQLGISGKSGLLKGSVMPKRQRTQSIYDEEKHFLEKIGEIIGITKDHLMSELDFPDNLPADIAASFLVMANAMAFIPTNDKHLSHLENAAGYAFPVITAIIQEFLNMTIPEKGSPDDDNILSKMCYFLDKNKEQINIEDWDKTKSAGFWLLWHKNSELNRDFFNQLNSMRDKINIIYSLCSDNWRGHEFSPKEQKKEEIFRHFILQTVKNIENATTAIEQEDLLNKFMRTIIVDENILTRKFKDFSNVLGVLKKSVPVSLPVILDDGTRTDFFNLDKNKQYRIMHSINVSKSKDVLDFSNCVVNGDFICAHLKNKIILPKQINGTLDCFNCYPGFISQIKIPEGTTYINLSGAISGFDELLNIKLPKSVRTIEVLNSKINALVKNPDEMAAFNEFTKKHPRVQIVDTKHKQSAQNVIAQNQTQKSAAPVKEPEPAPRKKQEPVIPEKTEEWLNRKEIIALCSQDERFADVDLEKAVKSVTKGISQKRIANGITFSCIHIDSLNDIQEQILQNSQSVKKVAETKENSVNPVSEKAQEQNNSKTQKPVKIKKYIPKQIWKDICNSCGTSFQLLYSVLDDINKVNNSYDTQTTTGSPIQYIDKDGNWQCVTNTDYKGKKAATQWISKRDNRRIVWTINSGIMIAIAFFEDHVNNSKSVISYREALANAKKGLLMDGKTVVDKNLVKSDDFLNVSDLLKQYKTEKKTETKVSEQTVAPTTNTVKQVKSEKTVPEKQEQHEEKQVVAKPKRKRIHSKPVNVDGLVKLTALKAEIDAFVDTYTDKESQLEMLDQLRRHILEKELNICRN